MQYNENIFELFKTTLENDSPQYNKDWISSWSYQEKRAERSQNYSKGNPSDFFSYVGPEEIVTWMNWAKKPKPDHFSDHQILPLIHRSVQLDKRITHEYQLDIDVDSYEHGVARNNAQDYLMANAYPMPGATSARKVLDFGAGFGRQVNLWSQMEDDGLVFIGMDGIPKPYCLQHFYYSNIDRPFYDYVIEPSSITFDSSSRGVYHIPTWRFDLIGNDYLDKIITVQVLPELSERLVQHVCNEFFRTLKPGASLYLRDHKTNWQPVHTLDVDRYLESIGFVKEFELYARDKVDFHGIPRIFRKPL